MFYSRGCTIIITAVVVAVIVAATLFYFLSENEQGSVMHSLQKMNPFREKTTLEKAQDAAADIKDELEYGWKKTIRHLSD